MSAPPDSTKKKFSALKDKTFENCLAHKIGEEFPRMISVVLDAFTAEDADDVIARVPAETRLTKRAVRLCRQAQEQGALLSNVDLAAMLSSNDARIAHVLTQFERSTQQVVPRRATLHDVGTGMTHKAVICRKRYEEGKTADVVARETCHTIQAVDRYLGQYDRVRHCRLQGMNLQSIAFALGCSKFLVQQYLDIDDELTGGGAGAEGGAPDE